MIRWLFLAHRYLGIATCLLMVAWCASGVVMLYVHYPSLSAAQRLQYLQPLNWNGCCSVRDGSVPDNLEIEHFDIEMAGTRTLLRLKPVGSKESVIDLDDGRLLTSWSTRDAEEVAAAFGRTAGCACSARLQGVVNYDQWTVAGDFNSARPLFLFSLDDPARTQLYVSSADGKVVQVTTGNQRLWNWLGAIPHWLYFSRLRHNPQLWNQVVIWTSVAGSLLTLIGLYIGVRQWLRAPAGRWSPYKGVSFWHHIPGLIFGLFLLSWVASGLLSMNPWGLLDSDRGRPIDEILHGQPFTGAQVKELVRNLRNAPLLPDVVSVESVPLMGKLYVAVTTQRGTRWRFDDQIRSARLTDADWTNITRRLGGATSRRPKLLTEGDAYYFDRHDRDTQLPVYRIIAGDAEETRYYLDPLTGSLIASFDSNARWYRWLHQGAHTLDFSAALRTRPHWDVLMIILLLGASTISVTGAILGVRRVYRAIA